MHPAFSVIFFTVSSGAGYGLFVVLVVLATTGLDLRADSALTVAAAALAFVTLGLISSLGHLANPKNAWRAFSRFRTSWLSREGVLAVAFYLPAFALLCLLYQAGDAPVSTIAAKHPALWPTLLVSLAVGALATVFSTGMIYACLKTIRQWHTPLVPTNYIAMSLSSGMLLFVTLLAWLDRLGHGLGPTPMQIAAAAILLAAALSLKSVYYSHIGKPRGSTINTATGFQNATVRLLDVGYASGDFLTEEFGRQIDPRRVRRLRLTVLGMAFALPFALVTTSTAPAMMTVALAANLAGALLERWLFFAEARHVVNLYHGAQHT